MRVVAFLRAINVGGHNKVPMADLKEAFGEAGFEDVSTYVQTGNVLFTHDGEIEPLYDRIEALLESTFGFRIPVILRTQEELKAILANAPFEPADDDYSHQMIALFRNPYLGELPPDPPKGGCAYLLKTEREIYSKWWKVGDKFNVPNPPKTVAVATVRNRRVLMAIADRL
jgi:uncharacterized protein (DUF1697 family)